MKKCAVIGLGLFGASVARSLVEEGAEVIAIDSEMEKVEDIKEDVSYAVRLDASEGKALDSIGIGKMDVVVVAIERDFEACQLAVIYAKQAGVPRVIARAISGLHSKILKLVGADEIVNPEFDFGRRLGSRLVKTQVMDYVQLADGFSFVEQKSPKKFWGKTPIELDLRKKYKVNLICIKRLSNDSNGEEKKAIFSGPDTKIEENDILLLVGKDEDLEKVPGV